MKYLIVDDEHLARDRLKELIRRDDASHVLLEADNGVLALTLAQREKPDAVLLDIRMPGMDGIETACHLAALETPPAVIFTTAYDDHALAAFEAGALDYLLKPIRPERLREALSRARAVSRARSAELRHADPLRRPRTHLSITSASGVQLIPVAEIQYLRADQKYVCVGWAGREYLLDESLRDLEEEFGAAFLRIHRGALVAFAAIEALEKNPDGSCHIRLREAEQPLPVSRRHLREVRQALKEAGTRGA